MAARKSPKAKSPRALARRYGVAAKASKTPQALLFPRSDWAMGDALLWAEMHGYSTKKFDVTESHVRVFPRGKALKKAKKVRTIPFGPNGVRAVAEWR
jgi:hypothetical protein